MRALFWNIRGFGHDGRRRQLVEYIRDEHIDIIAIQETMRTDFCLPELDSLSSHLFALHLLPSSGNNGHSGGILLGVKDATFEVGGMDRGEFFISMEIFERALNFKWEVIIVYGPADHSRSPTFLAELQQKISAFPSLLWWEVTLTSSAPRMRRTMTGLTAPGCRCLTTTSRSLASVSSSERGPGSPGLTARRTRRSLSWTAS